MFANDDRLRNEVKHECELPAQDDIVTTFIKTGPFILFRRKFRRYFMISVQNNDSKLHFKSTFTLNKENLRHLNNFYYTIHPFSSFRTHWIAFMVVNYLLQFILIPLMVISDQNVYVVFTKIGLDFMGFLDMIVIFNTGYLDLITHKVVLAKKAIAKKYLQFWFWVDCFSMLNYTILETLLPHIVNYYFYFFTFLKMFRVVTMFEYVHKLGQAKQQSIYKYKIFQLMTVITLMYSTCFCLVFITLNELMRGDSYAMLLGGGQKLIYLMLLIGWEIPREDVPSLAAEILTIMFGFLLRVYIISELLHVVNKFTCGVYKHHQMVEQLEEYMNYKKLPMNIRRRVQMYFDYGSRQRYYEESKILQTLSPQLKNEIMLHAYLHLLEKVELFSDLPVSIYYNIIYKFKRMVYLPSEVIISCDTIGDCMYFISSGTVAVYTASGKEVCHLADGANFGELAVMIENEKRAATVVAIECCEIFQLQRSDLLSQIQNKPDIYDNLKMIVHQRYSTFREKRALSADEVTLNELLTHI